MRGPVRYGTAEGKECTINTAATLPGLSPQQQHLVHSWLPGAVLVADMSWGLVDTAVLHLRTGAGQVIVKAHGADNHHFPRELKAHREWLAPLRSRGAAAPLLHSDEHARILVTEYLPGELVQGHPREADPDAYRQAGALLAALHEQDRRTDAEFNHARLHQALRWLDGDHRIPPETEQRLRQVLAGHPTDPVVTVPTHGDYQPRNWLTHDGDVAVIDFGRAGWRPPQTDLARLAAQQFRTDPDLATAFYDGYGSDPRDAHSWQYVQLTEAIATAAWAYLVRDKAFEAQGHRMIAEALTHVD